MRKRFDALRSILLGERILLVVDFARPTHYSPFSSSKRNKEEAKLTILPLELLLGANLETRF